MPSFTKLFYRVKTFFAKKEKTIKDFVPEYLKWYRVTYRSGTYQNVELILRIFLKYLKTCKNIYGEPVMFLNEITELHIEHYKIYKQKVNPKINAITLNNNISAIKVMFRKACAWGYIAKSPAENILQLKTIKAQPRALTNEEVKRAIQTAASAEYLGTCHAMIVIAYYTGFRFGEIYNLQWQDIDFDKKLISVNPKKDFIPKNGIALTIPLSAHLEKFLLLLPRWEHTYIVANSTGKRFTSQTVRAKLRKVFDEAGLPDVSLHKLRHTFASHLAWQAVPMDNIKDLLGHSSTAITNRYRHIAPSYLAGSINLLPDLLQKKETAD